MPEYFVLRLTEPEPGVYVVTARGHWGATAIGESTDSPYEAACDALASVMPSVDPTAGV